MERIEKPKDAISSTSVTVKVESGKGSRFREQLFGVLGVVVLTTVSALLLERADKALSLPVHSAIFVMPYLLGVVLAALKFDRWASMATATLTVISLVVIFIHPLFEKTPKDFDYLLILAVFLIISIVINELSFTTRKQSARIAETEARMETERLKNTLLRSVSHDLRSPLSTIMGAASSLCHADARELKEHERQELAISICRESERLDRQVGNLLEMTSLESASLVLQQDWYSLEELIGDALTALERRLKGVKIDIEIEKDAPLLFVDGLLIQKVFVNLVENCLKYAPDEKYRISAGRRGEFVDVEVFNSGKPISAGEEKKIFEKFYRGSHREDGAGLGLAICQSIVQLHGGAISCREGVNDGVAIKFQLPVRDDEPEVLTDG
ncbi:MAG: DUF4118 domain-containing protein [Candidatus Obscuribacterales bacterium]|nr:DUF4118 domain-containing protein [Candidatus Obscuribacterales bacterium]